MANGPERKYREGWMVVRMTPWDVRGIFTEKTEADRAAKQAGKGYEVKWGCVPADHALAVQPEFAGRKPKARKK
jgi:hypothetical protein